MANRSQVRVIASNGHVIEFESGQSAIEIEYLLANKSGCAARAIKELRSEGKWLPAFDRIGLPVLFSELQKSPRVVEFRDGNTTKQGSPLDALVSFIRQLVRPGEALHQTALDHARQNGVSYGEALSEVAKDNSDLTKSTVVTPQFAEDSVRVRSEKLHDLANQRAKAKKISYGEALSQVAEENRTLSGAAHPTEEMDRTRRGMLQARLSGAELDKLVKDLRAQKDISYSDALQQVLAEHPELA